MGIDPMRYFFDMRNYDRNLEMRRLLSKKIKSL